MAHTVGIVFSMIGLWRTSAAVIGECRLREWKARIRTWIRSKNSPHRHLRRWAARVYGVLNKDETLAIHASVVQLRNIIVAAMLLVFLIGALSGDQQIDDSLFKYFIPPMLVIVGFVMLFRGLILVLSLTSYLTRIAASQTTLNNSLVEFRVLEHRFACISLAACTRAPIDADDARTVSAPIFHNRHGALRCGYRSNPRVDRIFRLVKGIEPLNTNFSRFWIYITVKAFAFPRESTLT